MTNTSSSSKSLGFSTVSSPTTPVPEPGPDWPKAKLTWGLAWEFHWIGLGTCFTLLAINSVVAMMLADKTKAFTRRFLFIAVNSLLVLFGTTRALYLLVDPYESGMNVSNCPVWITRPLFGIGFPCLTSSFFLIHLAFLEVAKLQLGPRHLQSPLFVTGIIIVHFSVVLVSDTTVAMKATMTEFLIVCQSFFIVWGFLNSISFLYSGSKVILQARKVRKQLRAIRQSDQREERTQDTRRNNTTKVTKITLVTSVLGFACTGWQTYSLVGVYGVYSKEVDPKPWPWWIFQTSFRLVELAMGCTIACSVLQPAIKGHRIFKLNPCRGWKTTRRVRVMPVSNNSQPPQSMYLHTASNSTPVTD